MKKTQFILCALLASFALISCSDVNVTDDSGNSIDVSNTEFAKYNEKSKDFKEITVEDLQTIDYNVLNGWTFTFVDEGLGNVSRWAITDKPSINQGNNGYINSETLKNYIKNNSTEEYPQYNQRVVNESNAKISDDGTKIFCYLKVTYSDMNGNYLAQEIFTSYYEKNLK